MSGKKYYWLKLDRNFFKRHDIQIVEAMQNGKDYVLFYLKLLVESIDHDGELRFSDTIPYDEQMLATITNTNVDIVRTAMKVFSELRLVEVLDDKTIFMEETCKMVGSECWSAERTRRYRERIKIPSQGDTYVTSSDDCVTLSDEEIEIELDKELDKDINITVSKDTVRQTDVRLVLDSWNQLEKYGIKSVSRVNYSSKRYGSLVARIKEYGIDDVLKAIENIKHSMFLQGKSNSRRQWVITFDWFVLPNNFPKVLDGNYTDKEDVEQNQDTNTGGGWQ